MMESYRSPSNAATCRSVHEPRDEGYGVGIQHKGVTIAVVATGLSLEAANAERRRIKALDRARKTKPVIIVPGFELQEPEPVAKPVYEYFVVDGRKILYRHDHPSIARAAQRGLNSPMCIVYEATVRYGSIMPEARD